MNLKSNGFMGLILVVFVLVSFPLSAEKVVEEEFPELGDGKQTSNRSDRDADAESLEELENALEADSLPGGSASNTLQVKSNSNRQKSLNLREPAENFDNEETLVLPEEELELEPVEKPKNLSQNVPPPEDITPPEVRELEKLPETEPLPKKGNYAENELPPPSQKNELLNLEFKMEGESSRIFVSSRYRPRFQEVRNRSMRQVVYLFENTTAPQRLERAYDTSEFVSPVALFTMLQVPGATPPMVKLIIQLREEQSPVVSASERGMNIDFPPPSDKKDLQLVLGDDEGKLASEENIYSGKQIFSGKAIERLEIKNSDVQDVLRLIGKSSGYNMVIGDEVTGKVGTLSLENIPWDQAFTLVLQSKKLGYIRQGNVLRVATLGALKSEKEESLATEQSKIRVEPLRTVLIPISYAKASELAPRAKPLLSERGTVDTDERTNTLIVRDIDRVVGKLQKLFAMLDTQPPVVSVSAKVVEVKSDFTRAIGMNFLNLSGSISGLNFPEISVNPGASGASSMRITAENFANLSARLSANESDGVTKVLANPSVSVNQNQKATMTQTLTTFFPVSTVTSAGTATTLQSVNSTLSLDVTPIVASDGSISMTVNVKNEFPTPVQNSGQLGTGIDSRNIQTQVIVENGDTAVIGGAFKNNSSTNSSGLPFFMRLPIVGFFFSQKNWSESRNEILIFLTAKIMNTEESFKKSF